MKRLFLFIAILCMGILHGLAQTYDYTDKNGVTWTFSVMYSDKARITATSGLGEEVVVPDTVYNDDVAYAVASLGESLFKDNETIKKVTLAKGITSLNSETFSGCSSLVAVENTELLTDVYDKAFYDCTSLASMDLPKCTSVSNYAFQNCTSIASIKLPLCTSTGIYAFQNCISLASMDLPLCTTIGWNAFQNCTSFASINLPQCKSVESQAFIGCTSLASIYLPLCTSVSSYAFQNCTSLASIDLPLCTSVSSYAFQNCARLASIDLPLCKSVENYAFQNCTSLASINLLLCKSVGLGAFENCTSLAFMDLPNCTSIENSTFYGCTNLASIELPKCTSIKSSAFSGCTNLTSIDLPNCTTIGSGAFYSCTSLTSVKLPKCKIIPDHSDYTFGVFQNCKKLQSFDFSNITSIGSYAFSDCTSLAFIDLPNCTNVGSSAFSSCTSLASIDLPNCTNVGSCAFSGCISLASIDLPNCTSVDSYAFSSCTSLASIDLPNCTSVGSSAFSSCTSLTSIDLPLCTDVEWYAFSGCISLTSINLPKCTNVSYYTFKNCTNLASIDMPNCTTIGRCAFYGCVNLISVKLPKCQIIQGRSDSDYNYPYGVFQDCKKLQSLDISNIESLGNAAFYGCDLLKDVSLPATLQKIGNSCFSGDVLVTLHSEVPPTSTNDNGTISFDNFVTFKVPEASLEAYRTAEAWKDLKSRIFPIGAVLDYDVTATAQSSTSGLANAIGKDNLDKVVSLKVSGTLNSYDIMMIRNKMDNLHHLDLANANIVANSYQYYTGCSSEDSIVGANAFRELNKLVTVKLPKSAKEIKNDAFYNCRSLTSIVMPEKLKYLDNGVFTGCNSLADVDFISCERIGTYAFGGYQRSTPSLKKLVLPSNLKEIGSYAFYNSGLQRVEFPPTLQTIGNSAFASCNSLDSISLPAVTRIGGEAFKDCSNIHEVRIPSSLEEIGDGAFQCSNMNNVYAYTVQPVHIKQNTFSNYSTATLHVPEQSFDNYYWDTEWSQFRSMEPFDEPYTFFYVSKAYTLQSRFSGKPSIDIRPTGGLVVMGDEVQNADSIHIEGSAGSDIGTILANGNLNGEKLYIDITKNANQWYFFSFPFDVKLKNVRTRGDYVWRKYNGAVRATNGNGGWAELDKDDEWLHRGEGYAFQSATNGTLTIIVEKEQLNDFIADNVSTPLASYASDNTQNASWNFIGNPHTGYFDLNDLGYDAPVTYWNGSSYVAVRPGDDDYVFKPLQAFFVQKPETADNVEFDGDKRLTKEDSEQRTKASKVRRMARGINANRQFVNLAIASADGTDHTRIVYNDTRSNAYEMECDAAKFLSMTDAPQIYTVEAGNTRLAINERPMGSVSLAFKAQHAGEFSISATRMDIPMLLKDNLTGTTFDLTLGDYTFTSEEGTHDGRFMLMPNNSATGIGEIAKKSGVSIIGSSEGIYISGTNGKEVSVYTIDGMLLATRSTDGLLQLSNGVYVVNVDGMTAKVMVK